MKVSENWLRDWVSPEMDSEQLAALLTMAGLEVDAVSPVCGEFNGVQVAHVLAADRHPQADKLSVCKVDAGEGNILQIICGAANVRAGLKVALATVGAKLPNGLKIKEAKLRGELSQGMLCSASELGLAESSQGIIELADDAPIGVDLHNYLALNDKVLDIDLTPNRADCFSILGVAREAAALTGKPLKAMDFNACQPLIDEQFPITLTAREACPQFCGRIVRNINSNAQTPLWMQERLRRVGLRSIHPVVDITNYVMMELGQPMHAYDMDSLAEKIDVRLSREGEKLKLLGGQEITLKANHLLIADAKKPLGLAGVMGGEDSAVSENTTSVFLESAFFNPLAIAGVARQYGLFTDASQRFERGVDPALARKALERMTALLLEITGGEPGPVLCAREEHYLPKQKIVHFNPKRVRQLTGIVLEEAKMLAMLERLGMTSRKENEGYQITAPTHRFDIQQEVDLVEEIVRLYGYDRIPNEPMMATVKPGKIAPLEVLNTRIARCLVSRGYHETISYSFVDPQLQAALYPRRNGVSLLNPISPELAQMRTGMWSGLLASMIHNLHRQQPSVKLFESGVTFERLASGEVAESPCIAGLLTGTQGALSWLEKARPFDFYDVKGDLQSLFMELNLPSIQWQPAAHDSLHPGKSACLMHDNQAMGWVGALHPRIAETLDLSEEVILFELRLDNLPHEVIPHYRQISKFPMIRRDLALLADEHVSAEALEAVVRSAMTTDWLKAFAVFDVYQGEHIPKGKKSLAVALTLQDEQRTLQDNEINTQIDAILKKLNSELMITLRE